jgi:hypothetical protein
MACITVLECFACAASGLFAFRFRPESRSKPKPDGREAVMSIKSDAPSPPYLVLSLSPIAPRHHWTVALGLVPVSNPTTT